MVILACNMNRYLAVCCKLPDDTLVFPAHDYKGDTVSTIGEERNYNPRLQVKSVEEYIDLMNSLNLANPKMMDVAVPANMHQGLSQEQIARCGWALTADQAKVLVGKPDVTLIDLREKRERDRHGEIPAPCTCPIMISAPTFRRPACYMFSGQCPARCCYSTVRSANVPRWPSRRLRTPVSRPPATLKAASMPGSARAARWIRCRHIAMHREKLDAH